jgi:hypothetical protein
MPDPTPTEIATKMSTAATAAFDTFGSALAASGVDAVKEWGQVKLHAAQLDQLGRQAASGIKSLHADESISYADRTARIADINAAFDIGVRGYEKDLRASLATVENSLLAAQRVEVDSDPFQRQLIRQEIDQLLAGNAGTADRPKAMLVRLQEIAVMSPKYAAEIADPLGIGHVKMVAAHEAEFAGDLYRNTIALAGASTPKAQAAKAKQAEMAPVIGHVAGLYNAAKFRVAGANTPKQTEPKGWQPDTLIQRH